ncbi:hypothetical protein LUZ60_001611 [Juncus effusus]|nr:hypothetical protein LUZ60_001611 [Juncus effusus]
MTKKKQASTEPVVVVVGGGIAGALVAKVLQSHAQLVLIDPKEYFEITWAELRCKVEPKFAERSLIKHRNYLNKIRIITSYATGITGNKVLTSDGGSISFDYLVITTGHTNSNSRILKDRIQEFRQDKQKIESAKSILIIGGGPTGVELAGEISTDFPNKKIILVHKGPRLLEFISPKASQKTLDWLISKKVEVLLNQSVDLSNNNEGFYLTSNGEKITSDCHFVCVGKPIGSNWLSNSDLKDNLDLKGRLMVDRNLRVKGFKNVFAAGDITDIPEIKQGYLAQRHAMVVVKNIKMLIKGINENKLGKYNAASSPPAIVSLGRNCGVAQFPCFAIIGWLPGFIKSNDLFVGKTRKLMGLKD